MSNTGFNSGIGSTGNVTTGPGNSGTGTTPTGGSDFSTSGGFNTQSSTDSGICPHCGQSTSGRSGLEQFLGRLGITDEMINNLKTQFQNIEIDELCTRGLTP